MPNAVIFDLDGVLIDSTEAHFRAWSEICRTRGIALRREDFMRTIGTGNDLTVKMLFGDRCTPDEAKQLFTAKESAYRQEVRKSPIVIDGAVDLVNRLHAAGWLLGLGTSAPRENVECVMAFFPAAGLLTAKINADMVRAAKPAPDLFLLAAETLGVRPADCVVIEDSLAGLEAAKIAGMAGVGLTTSLSREELTAQATLVVDSLRELGPETLLRLLRR